MSEDYKYELPKNEIDPVLESAMLTIVKRYADLHEKIYKELGTSGGWDQCSRVYNGKRYRIIVSEYEHCPVAELTRLSRALAGRDPAKLDALVEAVKRNLDILGCCDHFDHHGNCQTHYIEEPCRVDELRNALAAFEGGEK